MKKLLITLFTIPFFLINMFSIPVVAAEEEGIDRDERTLQDEIIYDIFIDRFNNGRQAPSEQIDLDDPLAYHGGDIQGITKLLDQLKEAGFTAISVSPVMENAPGGYHGYWVDDFFEMEEEFGSMEDLQTLVEEAHERDMKVILELVTNYVAKSNPLVDEEEKEDWFKENEVEPMDATSWLRNVSVLDQTNPDVQDYLLDVADFWMTETDIDGYTLHAADQSAKGFIEKLANQVKEKDPDFYLIATALHENSDTDSLFDIEELDAIANMHMFEVMNEVLTEPDQPISTIYEIWEEYGDERSLLYVDNINTPRFSNNFADKGRIAETTWKLALGYLYFTPGVPIIYQGSEVPMYGPGFPENQYIVDFTSQNPDLEKVFEKMATLKAEFPALVHGDIEQVDTDEGMSLFKRTYEDETVFIGINNDSESRVAHVNGLSDEVQLKGLLHDDTIRQNEDGEFLIGMERESTEVLVIRPNVGFNWGFIGFVAGVMILFVGAIIVLTIKQRKRDQVKK